MAKRIVAADNEDLVMMHRTATQLFGQTASLKARQALVPNVMPDADTFAMMFMLTHGDCSLEQARRKLIAGQPSLASMEPDELASRSYQDLAEHHILQLQDQLEAQVAMLRRHRQKLLQEAGWRTSCLC